MTNETLVPLLVTALLSASIIGAAIPRREPRPDAQPAPGAALQIPKSLAVEHEELHHELAAVAKLPGRTGEAAQRVATLLHDHFMREEEFALPPLGLLRPLAAGQTTAEMKGAIALTDRLKADLPRMLDEHKAIVGALEELTRAAQAEGHPGAVRFAEELTLHAQTEEDVLYPAAILVGEYLKLAAPR